MESTREKGNDGESFAANYYASRGFVIVERNWRFKKLGEIDLILSDLSGELLVVCEVKLRKNNIYQSASEAVNIKKQVKIRRLTEIFIAENPNYSDKNVRFDVAEVYPKDGGFEINLLEGAF